MASHRGKAELKPPKMRSDGLGLESPSTDRQNTAIVLFACGVVRHNRTQLPGVVFCGVFLLGACLS